MSTETPSTTARYFLGTRSELPDGTRRIVSLPEDEVGVIVHDGEIHAYRNRCAHQGGPVCEGSVIGRVEARLDEQQRMLGECFSEAETHLVCPWHGVEYVLATGQCVTNARLRLRKYEVVCDGDDVFLLTD